MFSNKSIPELSFVTNVKGLVDIEDIQPRLYAHMLPNWWSDAKKKKPVTPSSRKELTIKDCPAMPHFFSQAYVMPMWADTEITVKDDGYVFINNDAGKFNWHMHDNSQFMNLMDQSFNEEYAAVAKAISPWEVITSPGYSIYQMSPFYHFNENFSILPGTIATDIITHLEVQMLLKRQNKTFLIKRGEPLSVYIPYKREKIKLDVRYATSKDQRKMDASWLNIITKFNSAYKDMYRDFK